jgi:uncharacterized protein (TIRG00374 family)
LKRLGRTWTRWLGIGLSLALIIVLIHKTDLGLLRRSFAELEVFWLGPMALIYLSGFLIRGMRWQIMLQPIKRVEVRTATEGVLVGYMGNNLLPARAGEVLRAVFLGNKEGFSRLSALGTIFIERAFDGLVIVGVLLLCALFSAPQSGHVGVISSLIVGGSLFGAAILAIWMAAKNPSWAEGQIRRLNACLPAKISKRFSPLVGNLFDSLAFLRGHGKVLLVLLLSVCVWGVEGLVYLGYPADWGLAYFTLAFVNLGMILPSAPAGIGVFQAGAVVAFSLFGLTPERALSYGIVVHAVMILPVTIIGLGILSFSGISLWKPLNSPLGPGVASVPPSLEGGRLNGKQGDEC